MNPLGKLSMKPNDPYSVTDTLDDSLLQAIATRLETRARHPLFENSLRDYLDSMDIDTAASVLDIGCGTGVVARAIARRSGFSGEVLGVDLSPSLAATAARLASEEALDRVEFRCGDSRKLELPDGSFDAAIAHTLLSHVDNPLDVLVEVARLVRPGGLIAIFDGDFASLTFGHVDAAKGKLNNEAIISGIAASPWVMRQMPHLIRMADLQLVTTFPYVFAELGQADFWASAIESFRRLVPMSGTMTERDADGWAEDLLHDSAAGTFFGAMNYYTFVVRRPHL
jgi:ubiquinone/menaquinone biosynthesis C-methylase UbiE